MEDFIVIVRYLRSKRDCVGDFSSSVFQLYSNVVFVISVMEKFIKKREIWLIHYFYHMVVISCRKWGCLSRAIFVCLFVFLKMFSAFLKKFFNVFIGVFAFFCFITKWISYTYTYVPISLPSCISLPPTLPIPPL